MESKIIFKSVDTRHSLTQKYVDRILNEKYRFCYIIIFLQNNCILSVKAHLPPSCFSISDIRMPLGLNGMISVIGQAADMVQLSSMCMWELSDCWSWCQLTELSTLLVHLLSLPFKISSKITLWFSIEMKSYFLCRSMETKPKGLNLILAIQIFFLSWRNNNSYILFCKAANKQAHYKTQERNRLTSRWRGVGFCYWEMCKRIANYKLAKESNWGQLICSWAS